MLPRKALFALAPLLILAACTKAPQSQNAISAAPSVGGTGSSATATESATASPVAPSSSKPAVPSKPVHVSLLESDGGTFGVGMPIIAWFNVAPTSGVAFAKATTVTADGKPLKGAWYFERTSHAGSKLEGHFRPQGYWPAHANINLDLPVKGLSAGKGLVFDDSLTLSIATGAANISTVDAKSLRMTVRTDGKVYGTFPVSLGAANTPTLRGTKVIMDKGADISMRGPGYFDPHVQWTQRLTYGGEYLHAAPWNIRNLGVRSTSNGCTNLSPAVAKKLYGFLRFGDVVLFPNASGSRMQLGQGYGDWNLDWATWQTGGAIKTA